MNPETVDVEYQIYLVAWLVAPVLLFAHSARRGGLAGFLVFSYLLGFFMNHWFGALAHASPWSTFLDPTDTIVGFHYSTYGLFALVGGVMIMNALRPTRTALTKPAWQAMREPDHLLEIAKLSRIWIVPIGILAWVAALTPLAELPSASALLSAGKQCLLLGICLLCWSAWLQGNRRRFAWTLAITALLPFVTVVSSGFIGYGMVMVATILAFVAMFYRPRWHLLAGLLVLLYAGLSLWVAYAAHRGTIREAVWGGQSIEARIDATLAMLSSIAPFSIANPEHLQPVDDRLNQNYLVGAAVRTTPSLVPFRNGETIYSAVYAFIPRAIWPNKPVVAGSGSYVSDHTLISFAQGTSVGMGQVLEFYINFGMVGLVTGFVLLGMMLRYVDMRFVEALTRNDLNTMMVCFLAGSGMLQSGGAIAEISASVAAGVIGAIALSYVLKRARRRTFEAAHGRRRPL